MEALGATSVVEMTMTILGHPAEVREVTWIWNGGRRYVKGLYQAPRLTRLLHWIVIEQA
jgi:hypothetical protein